MLTRIYGTAWRNDQELKDYLTQIEEAEKRDHRKLGKELELFHMQDEAQGSVFWHPKGWTIWSRSRRTCAAACKMVVTRKSKRRS